MRKVYLDYAATTPIAPSVKKAMDPYWEKFFGNPMAMHSFGQEAREAIEGAREKVAAYFNREQEEIIFTSGATESNNLALKGVAKAVANYVKRYNDRVYLSDSASPLDFSPHIITTPFEHHCLLDTAKNLLNNEAEVTFIKIGRNGIVDPKNILKAIKPNTVLVSAMYVNNEIGTVAPLKEIGDLIQKERIKRKERAGIVGKEALPIYFHSDITQGVNYLPCNMKKMGVDLFSFSGHKIYGPKGVGALGVSKGILIEKIQYGGSQEFNLRAGTHNVTGIVGIGAAIKRMENGEWRMENAEKVKKLRDYFWEKLRKEIKDIALNGSWEKRAANNLNVSFVGVEGESMLLALDMAGVACSTGSACSSETLEPSHVLMAIGLSHPQAHGSLRFTLGEGNTQDDIDYATLQIKNVVNNLRRVSGYKG